MNSSNDRPPMFYEVKSKQQHPVELHKHYWQINHTKSQMPKTKSVALSLTRTSGISNYLLFHLAETS